MYVTPFPGPGNKRQISNGGGTWPIWRRDGTELFHAIPGGQLVAVELSARNGALELGNTQKLFDGIITTRGQNYDATADGQKFLVTEDTGGFTFAALHQQALLKHERHLANGVG